MKLYLVQHGESKPEQEDPQRPLTDRGREEVSRVAVLAARIGVIPSGIYHSGKLRALQTAELLTAQIRAPLRQVEGLAPNDPIEPWVARLVEETYDLMMVGHLPFMERLCSALLTGSPEVGVIRFRQGGMVCLEREDRRWRLLWVLWPEMQGGNELNHALFHLAFPVSDLEEAKRFYVEGLGCRLGRESPSAITLELGGHQIIAHLTTHALEPQKGIYPRHFGLIFRSEEGWQALADRAKEKGLRFYHQPRRRFLGTRLEHTTFFLEDPFHNLLEFKYYKYDSAIFGEQHLHQVGDPEEEL